MSTNNLLTLMDQVFDGTVLPATRRISSNFFGSTPALNVKEMDDSYEISLTAPGIDISKAKIEVRGKVLNISYNDETSESSQEQKTDDNSGNLLRQEFLEMVSFSRSVALPENIEKDDIKATYKKGILMVILKKKPEAKPKSIEIKVSEE